MKDKPTIARRDLLRGTAALVGGSALGLLPSLAEAALGKGVEPLALGFWNGRRFVAAESLRSVAKPLESVRLTVTSVGGGGLSALEAHAPTPNHGDVPFLLWVAPPAGFDRTRAVVPTSKDGGLLIAAHTKDGKRHELKLRAASLREGTYILTAGKADWSAFHLDAEERIVRALGHAPHVRIDVEKA